MARSTEIRFDVDAEEVGVLDGYCHATGGNRTDVMRALLREWSQKKLHEATVILRVAGGNPPPPRGHREAVE